MILITDLPGIATYAEVPYRRLTVRVGKNVTSEALSRSGTTLPIPSSWNAMRREDPMQDVKHAPAGISGKECSPIRVRDVMTSRVLTLRPEQSVQEAVNLFAQREFRHIPVVDGAALVGVLSDRDAFRALAQQSDLATLTVASVMRREVQTVTMSMPLGQAAQLLIRHRINCLPVMDGSRLAGIVTTTDLLQTLATHG